MNEDHPIRTVAVNDPSVEPHIWTKYGLLPESSLEYSHDWELVPGANGVLERIRFRERYFLKQTGEVVKEAPHIYINKGLLADGVAGAIN